MLFSCRAVPHDFGSQARQKLQARSWRTPPLPIACGLTFSFLFHFCPGSGRRMESQQKVQVVKG
jgi:hypothetical protein